MPPGQPANCVGLYTINKRIFKALFLFSLSLCCMILEIIWKGSGQELRHQETPSTNQPFDRQKHETRKIALLAGMIYLIVGAALFLGQRHMLYFPDTAT